MAFRATVFVIICNFSIVLIIFIKCIGNFQSDVKKNCTTLEVLFISFTTF